MSGQIDFQLYPLLLLSAIAACTDLAHGRIYNWLTLPAIVMGLAAGLAFRGWAGLGDSILGLGAGLLLYGWMYVLRAMGAGDVKFLMALGAWGGWRFCARTAVLGVVLGGAMALVTMLANGQLLSFIKRMYVFFLALFIKELEADLPRLDRKLTMPFGIPIAAAAAWVAISDPFVRWGINLW